FRQQIHRDCRVVCRRRNFLRHSLLFVIRAFARFRLVRRHADISGDDKVWRSDCFSARRSF
ncbi:MAG TPA: hypothetical protein VGD05_07960, partial [Pyrinomonadaceae bacterium]